MKYDFITIGGVTEDITFYTQDGILIDNKKDILRQKLLAFEYGAKLKIDKAFSSFGGGAANTAVNFSGLGFRVATLVSLGRDDRAGRIMKNFKKQRIDTRLVQRSRNRETGFSFLLVGQDNEHIVFSNRAANKELKIRNYELRMLKKAKWIYITSLSGKWQEVLRRIFSKENFKIAWNPGHIQLNYGKKALGKYLKKTEVLIVNKDEAIELVLSDKEYSLEQGQFLNSIRNLLRILKSWGAGIVVITNGNKGAHAYNGKKVYYQKILKESRRVDTTGVGDAFGSSFVAGMELFDGDIQKAMHLGVKVTASVIAQQGAQNGFLTRRDLKL